MDKSAVDEIKPYDIKNIYNNIGRNNDFAEMYRNKMEWLFKVERERYRRETEEMVIEQQV